MNPIVRSTSTLIPVLFSAFAFATVAHAQPMTAPGMPLTPAGPSATPAFSGHAPDPSDPSSPYYVPPPASQSQHADPEQPPAPIVGGVAPGAARDADLASDQPADRTGLEVGLRSGVGFPMSAIKSAAPMSSFVSTEFPIWLSVGYRATENLYVGIYGQYGFLGVNACAPGESCSAYDLRAGIDVHYHLRPREQLDPWFGYGAGFEQLGYSGSAGGDPQHFNGFELANLQLGADWRVARALTVGPFGSFSIGEYSSVSEGTAASADLGQKTMHEWFMIGLRAQLM